MKRHIILLLSVAACALLSSCSTPGSAANDPFRNAQGYGMSGQMAAHQQASMSYSSQRMGVMPPMQQVPAFPAFQPFAR